jgi:hypothetical protein
MMTGNGPEDDVFGGGGDGDRDGDGEEDGDGDRDGDREEDGGRARDGDIIEDVPASSSASTTWSRNGQPASLDIPQHKWDENNPDRFHEALVDAESLPPRPSVHTDNGVYMLYVLVTWLHSQFHLPFRARNTILMVFALILHAFGVVVSGPIVAEIVSPDIIITTFLLARSILSNVKFECSSCGSSIFIVMLMGTV